MECVRLSVGGGVNETFSEKGARGEIVKRALPLLARLRLLELPSEIERLSTEKDVVVDRLGVLGGMGDVERPLLTRLTGGEIEGDFDDLAEPSLLVDGVDSSMAVAARRFPSWWRWALYLCLYSITALSRLSIVEVRLVESRLNLHLLTTVPTFLTLEDLFGFWISNFKVDPSSLLEILEFLKNCCPFAWH